MGRNHGRITKMTEISTSLAALRHTALLIAESIMVEEDPTKLKQDRLSRLQSTIEEHEIALEVERRPENPKVIASEMRRLKDMRSLEERPLIAPPVLWA